MYKKKILADKFNMKKIIQNDINRVQNVYQKIKNTVAMNTPVVMNSPVPMNSPVVMNSTVPMNSPVPMNSTVAMNSPVPMNSLNVFQSPGNTIYKFDKKKSTNIKIDVSRENQYDKIPKISFKEVPIPSYLQTDKFELNTINQNISTPIHMDMFISDIINDGDINRIKKKNIHKIFHVYQEKYPDNSYPTGFGDFIRSCFFIIQFCTKYGFQYEIIINHPIAQFLNNFHKNYSPNSISSLTLNNKVFMFSETNWLQSVFDNQNYIEQFLLIKQKFNLFIDYLCSLPVINRSVFTYNILFPYDEISLEECNKIRVLFEPSREIEEKVDEHLSNLGLIKNQFIVLHIRSGDSYLKNENKVFDSLYFEIVKNEIIEIIFKVKLPLVQANTKLPLVQANTKLPLVEANTKLPLVEANQKEKSILLISDNNEIKLLLNDEFPNIKFLIYNITHIGEGVELETKKVENTMLDFYLMSNSSAIYSLTSYPHGSGFSYWCAKMYGIPYKCKYVKPSKKKNETNLL